MTAWLASATTSGCKAVAARDGMHQGYAPRVVVKQGLALTDAWVSPAGV